MTEPPPLCDCATAADCPFGNAGRRFRFCQGSDPTTPDNRREAYRQLVTEPPRPLEFPEPDESSPPPSNLVAKLQKMTPDERAAWRAAGFP